MDETKHLDNEISFGELTGSKIDFQITSLREEDGNWVSTGRAVFSSTRDNVHWGVVEMSAKAYDADPNASAGTVMMAIFRHVNSEDFDVALFSAIEQAEKEDAG